MKTPYLIYTELHVDDRTFYIHSVIYAQSRTEAEEIFGRTHPHNGKGYTLQPKGFLGELTPVLIKKFLKGEDIASLVGLPVNPLSVKFITGEKT